MGVKDKTDELKTLKDIEETCSAVFDFKIKLRQEAIKRAKHYDKRVRQMEELDENDNYQYFKGMRDAEMFAHNLTEEDLK